MASLWLVLDVETTGLDPATAGVWQLGAVLLSGGVEITAVECLVQPALHHWTEAHRQLAREVSGLTPAEEAAITRQPQLVICLHRLFKLLPVAFEPVIVTSYNLAFERSFLEAEVAAMLKIDYRWGPCLMAAAAKALAPERERLSLRKACAALEIPWSSSHRALADARLAAAVGERLGVFTREEEPAGL